MANLCIYSCKVWFLLGNFMKRVQGWTNFFLDARFFGRAVLLARPIGHAKSKHAKPNCTSNRETTRKFYFCFFYGFHFSCIFAMRILFAWPKKDAPQTIIFILETVQKNILKAWNFTKTKLCHRWFDNNFRIFDFILMVLVIGILAGQNFIWI